MENFVQIMKQRMTELGIIPAHLAKMVNKSSTSIFNILNLKQTPSLVLAVNISKCLGISIDKSFGLKDQNPNDINDSEENSEAG